MAGGQAWTAEGVDDLVALASGESVSLEFKSALPEFNDRGKAELLKDVSAMANSYGGSILYGVSEQDGEASRLSGLKIEHADDLIRRIAQVLDSGIEPKLSKPQIYIINAADGDVLVIEVPQSFDGPHRFKFNNNYRFVVRNDRHISDLSYDQLRSSFSQTDERMRRLKSLWQAEIDSPEYWLPVVQEASVAVKLSSLLSAEDKQIIDPKEAHAHWSNLIMPQWGGGSPSYNYDGLAVHPGNNGKPLKAFVQVHRIGAITSWRGIKSFTSDDNVFYGGWVAGFLKTSFIKQKKFFQLLDIGGPFVLNFALSGVKSYSMVDVDEYGFEESLKTTVDTIDARPIWIEDISRLEDGSLDILRGPLDLMWQAFGARGCPENIWKEITSH